MWILQSPDASDEGDSWTFRIASPGHKTLGRAPTADFVIEAALVSRFHCRLNLDADGNLTIEDLKSTNGTHVNDARVDRSSLKDGDRIRIGRVELVVARA
jgi:pSer/pThr/pTyr-binding forkhead associated (FHA) protein